MQTDVSILGAYAKAITKTLWSLMDSRALQCREVLLSSFTGGEKEEQSLRVRPKKGLQHVGLYVLNTFPFWIFLHDVLNIMHKACNKDF